MFENVDGRTTNARVTGILIAHLGAFGSGGLKTNPVKPAKRGHSKRRPKIGFQDLLSLNAGQKYCRMLQGEHSEILSTFIKLSFVIKIIVLSIFEWPLKTGFTVEEKYFISFLASGNFCHLLITSANSFLIFLRSSDHLDIW